MSDVLSSTQSKKMCIPHHPWRAENLLFIYANKHSKQQREKE